MKFLQFKLSICTVLFTLQGLVSQQNTLLDSLVESYGQRSEMDSVKVDLGMRIALMEMYTNPDIAKKKLLEMMALTKKIGYIKGMSRGNYILGAYYYNRFELDSAEYYLRRSLAIDKQNNRIIGIMSTSDVMGNLFVKRKQLDSSLHYLNKNLELASSMDTTDLEPHMFNEVLGKTYSTISQVYTIKGMFELALTNRLKSLNYFKKSEQESFVADGNMDLGILENDLGNFANGLDYIEEALITYRKTEDVYFEAHALLNRALSEVGLRDLEKAIETLRECQEITIKNDYKQLAAKAQNILGDIYGKQKKFEEAETSYLKSVSLYQKLDETSDILEPYIGLGTIYNKMNRPLAALPYLEAAVKIGDSTENIEPLARAYKTKSYSNKRLFRFESALSDYERSTILNDSIYSITKLQQIEELRTIYDLEKKEHQLALQESEITLLQEIEKRSTLQKMALGIGLVLTFLVFTLVYYGIRQKMKRNKAEREKIDTELAFKKKELTTHALHLAKKNEVLESVKLKAKALKEKEGAPGYQELIKTINFDQQDDKNWESFTQYFEQVHKDFATNVKKRYPDVTKNELRFMALMKMNLSSKEIATILNISTDGIKKARQRLRKKMGLSPNDSLENIVLAI